MISRRDWVDLAWAMSYYARFFITYVPFYGILGAVLFLNFIRFLESHWFVWVTQMNHLVMEIDHEPYRDWFSSQVRAARAGHRGPVEPVGPSPRPPALGCSVGPVLYWASLGLPVAFRWTGPVGDLGGPRSLGRVGC